MQSYLYKASWHSTALKFRVEARDEAEALVRAERTVKRMEGGVWCEALELLSVTDTHNFTRQERERVESNSE